MASVVASGDRYQDPRPADRTDDSEKRVAPGRQTRAVRPVLSAIVRDPTPLMIIFFVAGADLWVGPSAILSLTVMAPMLAAFSSGPRLTAAYGVLSLVAAALLGLRDGVYRPGDPLLAQMIRLSAVVAGSVAAVGASRYRLRREQRLRQVTRIAEVAQRAILIPVPERLGPVRAAVHYESAAADALIGGDLYGLVTTSFGVRALMGDVRGKGLDAVAVSAQVLAAFRERANDVAELPVLLSHLEAAVERVAGEEDFVTAVLVQIDGSGELTVVNAGHPAPLMLDGGRATWLEPLSPRPPLGIPAVGAAPVIRRQLPPGGRLLLYTDGLTEARDPREGAFLPPERIVSAVSPGPAALALARLRCELLAWTGGPPRDDVALVLLDYVGHQQTADDGHEAADLSAHGLAAAPGARVAVPVS